jgi:hypothetical protein
MWLYEGQEFTDAQDYVGFVYIITNLKTGRRYIGKKLFTKAGTRQIKGKKKKVRLPSDWSTYFGSNKVLQADVVEIGADQFSREILKLCKTKGDCSYHEARLQFTFNVLELPLEFYNEQIMVRVHRKHLKL